MHTHTHTHTHPSNKLNDRANASCTLALYSASTSLRCRALAIARVGAAFTNASSFGSKEGEEDSCVVKGWRRVRVVRSLAKMSGLREMVGR